MPSIWSGQANPNNTCPVGNLHTEQTMENWIVQLWMFQTLIFEGHVDYTCPQEVIVVEIDKDLELGWILSHHQGLLPNWLCELSRNMSVVFLWAQHQRKQCHTLSVVAYGCRTRAVWAEECWWLLNWVISLRLWPVGQANAVWVWKGMVRVVQ